MGRQCEQTGPLSLSTGDSDPDLMDPKINIHTHRSRCIYESTYIYILHTYAYIYIYIYRYIYIYVICKYASRFITGVYQCTNYIRNRYTYIYIYIYQK